MKRTRLLRRTTHLMAILALLLALPSRAAGVVMPAYFGWNYVTESMIGPPAMMDLTSFTYDGGAGAGLVMALPPFPGFVGMPDAINPGILGPPTFTTGGDGETTRTIGMTLAIDWVPAGVATPWSGVLAFPSIGITGLSTSVGGVPFKNYVGFPMLPNGTFYYVVGLIPAGANTELNSLLLAPQGDIYGPFIGVPGNPTLTSLDPISGSLITVSFGAAEAVPEPASVLLLSSGLIGLMALRRMTRR